MTSLHPAKLDDTFVFKKDAQVLSVNIQWQQSLRQHNELYYTFKAKNTTAGDADFVVPVFVQKSFYDSKFGSSSGNVEFKITKEWQYGQADKSGKGRFVVLHNKSNKPYQHRFTEGALEAFVKSGTPITVATKLFGVSEDNAKTVQDVIGKIEGVFGDYLHDF
ncbi:hypothetical protein HGRIS_003919 [Hohenbuehelia grisea]|uniref:Uncharacterized protein n=1 Tax=Hohenbuehelia grisea TaxID=104357 RepID=A0ABR3JGX6_9AGAR